METNQITGAAVDAAMRTRLSSIQTPKETHSELEPRARCISLVYSVTCYFIPITSLYHEPGALYVASLVQQQQALLHGHTHRGEEFHAL